MRTFTAIPSDMRTTFLSLLLIVSLGSNAQTETDAVRQTIETFFKGFHQQDSMLMKSVVADGVIMQSTGRNKEGKTLFRETEFSRFLEGIVSIPDSVPFREEITEYTIKIDGTMANAWTDYKFWLKDEMSHCGVNSFQLINYDGDWRIIYIIDTRRKAGCE